MGSRRSFVLLSKSEVRNMANEKNLIPQAHTLTVEEQSKGGQISAQTRREKRTVQKILADYLDNDVQSNKSLKKIADAAGITGDRSIKELVTAVCILDTLKKGDVYKLQKLCELLGEDNVSEQLEDISEAEADVFGDS